MMKKMLFSLLAMLLVSSIVLGTQIKYGEGYSKILSVTSDTEITADKDYYDGKVTYIYKIYGVYDIIGNEIIPTKQEEMSYVSKNTYTCNIYVEPGKLKEGKYIAMCSIIKLDGTYDYTSKKWDWTWEKVAASADKIEVVSPTPPKPPSILVQIIQAIINFFKSLFGF